jgi:type III secretion system FlhB-like substrate exporter
MPEPDPPRRRASALHYTHGDAALVEALSALHLGAHVPEALWKAVAETLAWAYKLDAGAGRQRGA